MANANTEMTIEALHAAIAAQLRAQFPAFLTLEFYRDDESESMPTPAMLLEMTEAEPEPSLDAGTGQWPVLLRFDARIIMSSRGSATRMEVRKAATAVAAWLHLRRFSGVAADCSQVIACEPDEFAPHLDRFHVWRIEWVVPAMLGESAWKNSGVVPEAFYSFAPSIGIPFEQDYKPIKATP